MGVGVDPEADRAKQRAHRLARLRREGFAFRLLVVVIAAGVVGLLAVLAAQLVEGALASFGRFGVGFLSSTAWDAPDGIFGAWPAVAGTLLVSGLALLLALPVALGVALFASEIAPRRLRAPFAYFVDLGAAVPSIVYGFWAVAVLVPFLQTTIEPKLALVSGRAAPFSGPTTGSDVLGAAVVLAIMVVPTIAALSREALRAVPRDLREAALGLGATRWDATRIAVLGPAAPGIAGAVVLGLGRAIGETVAVSLVIGNIYQVPSSLFSNGATIPSWLINVFPDSSGLMRSALLELSVLLLVISVAINVGARLLVRRWERASAGSPRRRGSRRALPLAPPAATTTGSLGVPPWFARVSANRSAHLRRRRVIHALAAALIVAAVVVAVWPLASLIETAVVSGGPAVVTPSFYTSIPPPACGVGQAHCPIGGIGPEIEGTFVLLGLAAAIALPAGVLGGIYLSEYGRNRLGRSVAAVVDVLLGVPTILVGVVVFSLFLRYDRWDDQSAFAGAAALGVIMVPIVMKAAEIALRTVPASVREGALALGFPRHRVTLRVVLGSCRSALVTGSLLAVMRAAGETAAIALTAGGSIYWITDLRAPVGALPLFIYQALTVYTSPNYATDAWGAALVLLLIMAVVSLAARLSVRGPGSDGAV